MFHHPNFPTARGIENSPCRSVHLIARHGDNPPLATAPLVASCLAALLLAGLAFPALALPATAGEDEASAGPNETESARIIKIGLDYLGRGMLSRAELAFNNAEEANGGPCGECQLGLAMVYNQWEEPKKGEAAARRAHELLRGERLESTALLEVGKACLLRSKSKSSYYPCAQEAFLEVSKSPHEVSKEALYYLGYILLYQARDEEGLVYLRQLVEADPDHPKAEHARSLIERPLRARADLLPAFAATTVQGRKLTDTDLQGKVVLLDFWATWCSPCLSAIPTLRTIAKKHEDAPFLLVSMSVDIHENTVRDFLLDNEMDWIQVWDGKNRWGSKNLKVTSYPTYILIGPRGEILHRSTGGGKFVEQTLRREVAKAVRAAKR